LFRDVLFGVRVDEVSVPDKQVIDHIHCTVNNNKFMNKARFDIAARHKNQVAFWRGAGTSSGRHPIVAMHDSAANIINYKSPALLTKRLFSPNFNYI